MSNELDITNNEITTESIKIQSLEKLNNNYVHIIGNNKYDKINVVTNGKNTLNFNHSKIETIFTYNGIDYLISRNYSNEYFLISIFDEKRIIKKVKNIKYIGDGLIGVNTTETFSHDYNEIFDLKTNNKVPLPDNMIYKDYMHDLIILREGDKESYEQHKEMVINRQGEVVLPLIAASIRVIDKTRFMTDHIIIDTDKNIVIEGADQILPMNDGKIFVLKNRKLFILDKDFEVIKTYLIGETGKPWYVAINSDECITMTFNKKIRTKKYEPRIEKEITVIVNTKTDEVNKVDFIPSLGIDEVFRIKENDKVGLMNRKSEILLNAEYDNVKALHDSKNKYFFIEKDENYFIFNAETKEIKKVLFNKMYEYKDGLTLGYNYAEKKYQLLDEDLNIRFSLDYMGHGLFYYKNGILCYHSGDYFNNKDEYSIINESGEILMPSRKCRVTRNGFDILEIDDYYSGENILFNMNTSEFIELKLDVPSKNNKLDFSKIQIGNLIPNSSLSTGRKLILESNINKKSY